MGKSCLSPQQGEPTSEVNGFISIDISQGSGTQPSHVRVVSYSKAKHKRFIMHATKHCSKVHGSQKAFLQHSTKPSEKQQKDLCLRSSCFHPVVVLVLVSKTTSVICGAVILSSSAIHRSIGHCSIALPFSVLRFHLFHAFISNRSEKTGIAFYILHILSFLYKSSNKLWY